MTDYQVLPDLPRWEYEALKASIRRYTVILPVVKDEHGRTLDGHQRERACQDLGIDDYPVITVAGLTEEEKQDYTLILNLVRRRLNRRQMRELIAAELRRTPGLAANRLAQTLGTTDKTVEMVRRRLIATSEIPKFDKLLGKDEKYRKITRVTTHTLKEQQRAQVALRSLGDDAPRRPTELRLLERRAALKASHERVASEPAITFGDDAVRLYHCRFQRVEGLAGIEPSSVNLVTTDFPYDGGFLDQLPELAEFAERVLVPGGLFVTYCGQYHLDRVMRIFGERLTYAWTRSSVWEGQGTVVNPRQVTTKWKPILVYSKGPWEKRRRWCDVTRVATREKRWHRWQQPLDVVERAIRDFSKPGDLIVDPCGGGFTSAVACRWLRDRRCVSCDIDGSAFDRGRERLASEGVSDARQTVRELIEDTEDWGLSRGHLVRVWKAETGRTRRAFGFYLQDLGPEWVKRFRALGDGASGRRGGGSDAGGTDGLPTPGMAGEGCLAAKTSKRLALSTAGGGGEVSTPPGEEVGASGEMILPLLGARTVDPALDARTRTAPERHAVTPPRRGRAAEQNGETPSTTDLLRGVFRRLEVMEQDFRGAKLGEGDRRLINRTIDVLCRLRGGDGHGEVPHDRP